MSLIKDLKEIKTANLTLCNRANFYFLRIMSLRDILSILALPCVLPLVVLNNIYTLNIPSRLCSAIHFKKNSSGMLLVVSLYQCLAIQAIFAYCVINFNSF